MKTRTRKPITDESVLRLSPRELRALESSAKPPRAGRPKPLQRLVDAAAAARVPNSPRRAGHRGWAGKGTGLEMYVEPAPEYQGTTVQVCGMWPFIAGSGNPVRGVPLGPNLLNGSTVCADPIHWFLGGLVLNPSCFVLGRPGLGKSTLVRRMVTVLSAWGIVPMVLSDTKPDYVDLIRAMDGQVITLGPGLGSINPLDLGPLLTELERIPEKKARDQALSEMRARRQATVLGLLDLVHGSRMPGHAQNVVVAALQILDERQGSGPAPVISDLVKLIREEHADLVKIASNRGDIDHYNSRVESLQDALMGLSKSGRFGSVFDAQTSEHIQLGRPMVYDLNAIDDHDDQMLAALQSVCWAQGSALVSADKHLAEAGLRKQRHYFLVMDELWRMLRASPEMVYFVDALSRLNRARAIGQAMITHTMNDLELPEPYLTKIAWGFVERAAMVFLGGLATGEMGNLAKVFAMSTAEQDTIADWSQESSVNPDTSSSARAPGMGKFLLKTGKKAGIPFVLRMVSTEVEVNNTNRAWADAISRANATGSDLDHAEAVG